MGVTHPQGEGFLVKAAHIQESIGQDPEKKGRNNPGMDEEDVHMHSVFPVRNHLSCGYRVPRILGGGQAMDFRKRIRTT